jgi:hypothetical protein
MMNRQMRRINFVIVLLGGMVLSAVVLGSYLNIPYAFILIFVIVTGLVLGTVSLWRYANQHADGSEWWQDDSASGWRGY